MCRIGGVVIFVNDLLLDGVDLDKRSCISKQKVKKDLNEVEMAHLVKRFNS